MLWDCINCLKADTISRIRELGGIQGIAISHPHFYTGMADWAAEFDCPVYVHEKDRQWVTQPSKHIKFWTGKNANSHASRSCHLDMGTCHACRKNPTACVLHAGDKLRLLGAATVVRLGGHFPGSSVLHWQEGCDGRGILCTGACTTSASLGEVLDRMLKCSFMCTAQGIQYRRYPQRAGCHLCTPSLI